MESAGLNKNTSDLGTSTGVQISKPGTFANPQHYRYTVAPYLIGEIKPFAYVDSQPLRRRRHLQTFGQLRAVFTCRSALELLREIGGSRPTARLRMWR